MLLQFFFPHRGAAKHGSYFREFSLGTQRPENTNKRDLAFRALLTEDGTPHVELMRA
jgi:hypothetical protein